MQRGSASFGLLRIVMGDQVFHVNSMRVLFLACCRTGRPADLAQPFGTRVADGVG